jgi:hypothetical protein
MTQREPPSAAAALYPHLKAGTPSEVEPRRTPTLAEAMYPRPKPPTPNPYREILLRNLRELNADLRRR